MLGLPKRLKAVHDLNWNNMKLRGNKNTQLLLTFLLICTLLQVRAKYIVTSYPDALPCLQQSFRYQMNYFPSNCSVYNGMAWARTGEIAETCYRIWLKTKRVERCFPTCQLAFQQVLIDLWCHRETFSGTEEIFGWNAVKKDFNMLNYILEGPTNKTRFKGWSFRSDLGSSQNVQVHWG